MARAPIARAPLLSIHNIKGFDVPAERSMRRTPRPRSAPRALRVDRLSLPLSFKGSDALKIAYSAQPFSTTLTP